MKLPVLSGNWVDLIIILFLLFYVFEKRKAGFIHGLSDLAGFLISYLLAIKLYTLAAEFLIANFSLSKGIASALGFFIIASISEVIISIIIIILYRFLPHRLEISRINMFLGFLPSFISGFILVSFIVIAIIALPVRPNIKKDVINSKIGGFITTNTLGLEENVSDIFGGAVEDALTFLTVKPQGEESIDLKFKAEYAQVDSESEERMLQLVNNERRNVGLEILKEDIPLRDVGRSHCNDMLQRGYFSHYTPEGLSPFDRIEKAKIKYQIAGENLAFAPTVTIAHSGLMDSPGHRANILSKEFSKVGIGVISAGIYGKTFCQEFSD